MNPHPQGFKTVANLFFLQMRTSGYSSKQILQAVNELLELVIHLVQDQNPRGHTKLEPPEQQPPPGP
ncbi:hypothetical protein [Stigmatella hybrida]|uniref:hypothetical protein n=1 Tax=Stigmatella hybrida TaxID=394097 RepID=UPI001CDAF15A|nr:hypothetical protein [Stigmatella hybrida]